MGPGAVRGARVAMRQCAQGSAGGLGLGPMLDHN
jgi:hypothetical protein